MTADTPPTAQTYTLPPGQAITIVNAVSAPAPTPTPTPAPTPGGSPVTMPVVALINESTVPADWATIAAALQVQADRDFSKYWGTSCVIVVTDRQHAPAGSWWLVILDNSDMAGALGYHDLTPQGLPLGKVFAKTDQQYGLKSSVTASHELLEMLADPYLDALRGIDILNGRNVAFACEVCDPVEADNLGYVINGVTVSDFVTPAYYHPGRPGPYSFGNHVPGPLQLAHGGYYSYTADLRSWQQATAQLDPHQRSEGHPRTHAQPGSRRERRQRGRDHWRLSA